MVSRFFKKKRNHYVDVVVADKTGPTFRLFSMTVCDDDDGVILELPKKILTVTHHTDIETFIKHLVSRLDFGHFILSRTKHFQDSKQNIQKQKNSLEQKLCR
ncbi:hypothetical protein DERP_006037 [Dermatophagoides pteronyssinus]|uniref:Uncharacterized protein n=1 Tax=Dermatophagoides pteronyssinus TaxID=6956 RepID=A0ABQ8JS76_DERPT|nr:hypothetical protein DERP_006037 [Dermatophagoides pteronyssinus]